MSKINLTFNGKQYSIDKTLLSGAISSLEVAFEELVSNSAPAYSVGLSFSEIDNGESYLNGIGTCTDTDITIPPVSPAGNTVTRIISSAFANSPITGVVIPDNVYLDHGAFMNCSQLMRVVIGRNTGFGYDVFSGCTNLTDITFMGTTAEWIAVGKLEGWNADVPAAYVQCSDGKVSMSGTIIPDENTTTPSEGLEFRSNGNGTCYVRGLGTCTDTNIVIPSVSPAGDSVTSIGEDAFRTPECENIISIVIPSSVTNIEVGAFAGCINLESVVIPNGVTSIGLAAFSDCAKLTSVVIPASVTSLSAGAFSTCTGLTSIVVDDANTSYKSIDGNLYSKDGKTLLTYASGKTDTSFEVPDGVTSIVDELFLGYRTLTSIILPDSITSLGGYVFAFSTIRDIYYKGSEEEWAAIRGIQAAMVECNATVYYNYPENTTAATSYSLRRENSETDEDNGAGETSEANETGKTNETPAGYPDGVDPNGWTYNR